VSTSLYRVEFYDAEGNRVAKGTITSMSCDPSVNGIATANNETDYVLGPGGEQVTELAQDANGTMNWQRTYVYAGGALIATYDPNPDNQTQPLPSFRLTDWLGTLRATTDAYGVAQGTCAGLPFGDGQACSGDIPDNHHFTGKERDAESGNDYFGARYYASNMGRFMSPDWSAKPVVIPYADLANPQSFNMYSYVVNNPLVHTDPNGHDWFYVDKKWQWQQGSTYHDKDGNATKDKGYEYLMVFNKTGVNKNGATVGNLTLYDQNKAIASGLGAFSGGFGSGRGGIPNGAFMMRMDIRGTAGPGDIRVQGGALVLAPFYGAQNIPKLIDIGQGGSADFRWEWGSRRIALNPMPGYSGPDFEGNYLHGKDRPGDYTHNCICDRSEHMIDELYKLGSVHVPTQVQ